MTSILPYVLQLPYAYMILMHPVSLIALQFRHKNAKSRRDVVNHCPTLHLSCSRCLGAPVYSVCLHSCYHITSFISDIYSIAQYPNITFLVVVNPASGPGALPLPDSNYVREIRCLNSQANVRTLGYVSTNYTKRDLDDVKIDIQKYSAWHDAGQGLSGIFFDETPAEYNADSADFLVEAQRKARQAPGFTTECLVCLYHWQNTLSLATLH